MSVSQSKLEGKVLIAQGGGPTVVINQSIVGVAIEARKFAQVQRVYGAVHGIEGILNEDFLDMTQETTHNLELVGNSPASALGSTRMKPNDSICREIFKVLRAHDVRYFFYVGGNDSADTCRIVNEEANAADYDLRCIHVPKTIDNDLVGNDHSPGYGSAARFVASAFCGINLDNLALPGVYIGVVMGRHAGFLTASAALAKKYPDDGPHLVYLPERAFDVDEFLRDVKKVYDRLGRCVIAVSEGVADKDGVPFATKRIEKVEEDGSLVLVKRDDKELERDAHDNVQLSGTGGLGDLLATAIKARSDLNIDRVRADTHGYLQRSFLGCVSDTDVREAREVGEKGVHFALWHDVDGSVAIQRTGNYSVDYTLQKFENVAAKTKTMPDNFIDEAGTFVTNDFMLYVRPLIGSGFEHPHRIRAPKVQKLIRS